MQGMRIDAFRIGQRRQLYALDSSLHSPVCQLTERTEVAHTVAMAVAQGKDGNDDACHASRSRRDAQVVVAHHHHLMVLNADRFAAGGASRFTMAASMYLSSPSSHRFSCRVARSITTYL